MLSKCLRALKAQDFPRSRFEVIVVVDGSTDGTEDFLKDCDFGPRLQVLVQENRGLAAARNAGLQAAKQEVVLFLDDDLLCAPNVLSEHARAHEGKSRIVAFGPVLVSPNAPGDVATQTTSSYYAEAVYGPLERGEEPSWPVHARVPPNSSMSRRLLMAMGGFDERFVNAHEDIELGIRLWQEGLKFTYLPNATAEHVYEKRVNELAVNEAVRAGKVEVMLCRKHPIYRAHSMLAGIQETRLFQGVAGKMIAQSPAGAKIASNLLAVVRKSGLASTLKVDARELLGKEVNVNLQRSALQETGSWQSYQREFWIHLPVLLYHGVGEFKRGMGVELTVAPHQFAEQMAWLAEHGFHPISCSDWLAWLDSAKPLPPKPIIITFDDAYAELAEHALPVLAKYGFRATVYVPTRRIGESNKWDQERGFSRVDIMNADTIRWWAANGIEFGAHSRTHPELDTIPAEQLGDEIEGSRKELEQICGIVPDSFAYPYGSYNRLVKEVTERSFRIAVTTEEGMNHLGTDPLRLKRAMVHPTDSLLEFASRVTFGVNLLQNAKARVRGILDSRLGSDSVQ